MITEWPPKGINWYYSDKWVAIAHRDCREILPQLDVKVDLVLTSPPYDDLREYGGHQFSFSGLPSLLYSVMADGACCVWVVGDQTIDGSESGSSFKQALCFMDNGFKLHDTMIYQKDGPSWPHNNKYHQCFEYMFVFSKGIPRVVNLIRDRHNSLAGAIKKNRWERTREGSIKFRPKEMALITEDGIRFNIWCYGVGYMKSAKDHYIFEHPAIFPEALANDHIISWSNPNDLVLDPFLGSGTTAVCAKKLGRKCVGIEINPDYCAIAVKRLRQMVLPLEIEQVKQGHSTSQSPMLLGMTSTAKGNKISRKMSISKIGEETDR